MQNATLQSKTNFFGRAGRENKCKVQNSKCKILQICSHKPVGASIARPETNGVLIVNGRRTMKQLPCEKFLCCAMP